MQFGKEIRDVLVALETATTEAIRAVDRMNETDTDLNALLAGQAVSRVGELNNILFSKIEAAAPDLRSCRGSGRGVNDQLAGEPAGSGRPN